MSTRRKRKEHDVMGMGGFLGGLSTFLEKLGELADKGKELREAGELTDSTGKARAVFGFTVRTGLGGEPGGFKVEPFGNVRKDEDTGETVVDEVREPMVDVFDEPERVLVIAEMPGVAPEDVKLELSGDILTLEATRGKMKYRKEVSLPAAFSPDKLSHSCRNGVVEIVLAKESVVRGQ